MKAKKHLFDISHKDRRRETVCSIADILYEIFLIEEGILHELVLNLDDKGFFENIECIELTRIKDGLLDVAWTLANLYE